MENSIEQHLKAKELITDLSVNISAYDWSNYIKEAKKGNADIYADIAMGRYGSVAVMECNYDAAGYHPLDYKNVIREPEFI